MEWGNAATWASVTATLLVAGGVGLWKLFTDRRSAQLARRPAHDNAVVARHRAAAESTDRRDAEEADRVRQAAQEEFAENRDFFTLLGVSANATENVVLSIVGGHSEIRRDVEPSKLARNLERGVVVPANGGAPRQAVANRLNNSPLVKAASIDGEGYRVRFNFNQSTCEIEKK